MVHDITPELGGTRALASQELSLSAELKKTGDIFNRGHKGARLLGLSPKSASKPETWESNLKVGPK